MKFEDVQKLHFKYAYGSSRPFVNVAMKYLWKTIEIKYHYQRYMK